MARRNNYKVYTDELVLVLVINKNVVNFKRRVHSKSHTPAELAIPRTPCRRLIMRTTFLVNPDEWICDACTWHCSEFWKSSGLWQTPRRAFLHKLISLLLSSICVAHIRRNVTEHDAMSAARSFITLLTVACSWSTTIPIFCANKLIPLLHSVSNLMAWLLLYHCGYILVMSVYQSDLPVNGKSTPQTKKWLHLPLLVVDLDPPTRLLPLCYVFIPVAYDSWVWAVTGVGWLQHCRVWQYFANSLSKTVASSPYHSQPLHLLAS